MSTERELTIDELRDEELVCIVVGGSGAHIPNVSIEDVGGGGGITPAGAWNACLGVFGYGPQA
jgi:hypothetical protein